MSVPIAIVCEWTGEELRPANSLWVKRADQQWVVGERYLIEVKQERSAATHNHFFAALTEAWQNLPEIEAERFPTVDHLRRYALIRCGFRDERTIIASSKAEARRIAAFVRPIDEFAIVSVAESAVVVWTAKSQSMRAMGKDQFARSKDAVLEYVAGLIGTTPEQLTATRAA